MLLSLPRTAQWLTSRNDVVHHVACELSDADSSSFSHERGDLAYYLNYNEEIPLVARMCAVMLSISKTAVELHRCDVIPYRLLLLC